MKIFTYREYVDRLNEALEAEGLEKIDEKSPLDLTTESGTGGFFFGVLGTLFAGGMSIPFGTIAIAFGVAAGAAGLVYGIIKLMQVRRKKNLKKEITAAAEEYKELYKDVMRGATVELSKQMKKAGPNADKEKLKRLCQKKVELKKQKMDAVDKEITDRISDMSRKGGKNDPELHAWKTQEFNRVRVEALQEIIDEEEKDLDDNVIEAINKNIDKYKEQSNKLSKMSFEYKKGNVVPIGNLTVEEAKEAEKLYDDIKEEETTNESFEFFGKYSFLNESFIFESEEDGKKLYIGKVKYDSNSEGIKSYINDNKLDDSTTWTLAQDENEVKDVKDENKAAWYGGMYIYTISKEEATKKIAEIVDDIMTVCGKDIDNLKRQSDKSAKERDGENIVKALTRIAYGVTMIPMLKQKYSSIEVKNEDSLKKNMLFSLDFSSDAEEIKSFDDNNLAKVIKAYENSNTEVVGELVDSLKKATKDASKEQPKDEKSKKVEAEHQNKIDERIDSINDKLNDMDYEEKDVSSACNALRDDLSKVSNAISSSDSDAGDDENESENTEQVYTYEDYLKL